MKILAIETSCDETSASIVWGFYKKEKIKLLSNIVSSSVSFHNKTGGIIPEIAAREQSKFIIPVIQQALKDSNLSPFDIDAIAVTIGPGLIGSLLVGVETAKTLAYIWKKPIIPVNHLVGHIYANWLMANGESLMEKPYATRNRQYGAIEFPALTLLVSGGHTDLILMASHGKLKWLGGTRDDAAGEAFDKIGRLLGLSYPAGPAIEQLAKKGNPKAYNFPRPMIGSNDFDFSFSGLKTAVLRTTQELGSTINHEPTTVNNICASTQQAIIDVLIKKTIKAAQKYSVKTILLGGGVAANQKLKEDLKLYANRHTPYAKLFVPSKSLCTDNAAMIGAAAFYNYNPLPWNTIMANPELYFD